MAVDFLQKSAGNSASTTLSSSVNNTDTSFPLTSDTNFLSGGGFVIVDEGLATEELAYYTGKSGSALTVPLANRGLEGGSAQAHSAGATVKGVLSADMWNNVIEALLNLVLVTTGALDTSKVTDLTTAQTLTNKKLSDTTTTFVNASAATKVAKVSLAGATAGKTTTLTFVHTDDRAITFPDATDTLVGKATTDDLTNKTLITPVVKAWDGWNAVADSWSYASATTITVPSGAAALYAVGDRIKLTQTTVKYFVVTGVADTVLTVTGGTDYTVANAVISAVYVSHQATPVGFPHWFAYTPTTEGITLGSGTLTSRFSLIGKSVNFDINLTLAADSSITTPTFTLPIAADYTSSTGGPFNCSILDNGTAWFPGMVLVNSSTVIQPYAINASGTYATWATITASVPMTWANTDILNINGTYKMA